LTKEGHFCSTVTYCIVSTFVEMDHPPTLYVCGYRLYL